MWVACIISLPSMAQSSQDLLETNPENFEITYNYLNLPCEIRDNDGNMISRYTYSADSIKRAVVDSNGDGKYYVGSFVYNLEDGEIASLESVASAGGRTYKTDSGYEVRYFITDHLGSVRAVVNADGEVVEQNDYMPYGTLHANAALQKTDNRYLYGGKELQTDFGINYYDSFARFQRNDGAFNSIDPLAEKYYSISPYAYCAGNPVNLVDPDGQFTGRYYDKNGNLVADDKINDNKIYLTAQQAIDQYDREISVSADPAMAFRQLRNQSEELDGLIIITRTSETSQHTQGEFEALGKDGFVGHTMERPGPPSYEANKNKPIPIGLYNTSKREEGYFAGGFAFRIFNDQVPISRGILGHIGNLPTNSRGCLLFGLERRPEFGAISNSKGAMTLFEKYFRDKHNVKLIIK